LRGIIVAYSGLFGVMEVGSGDGKPWKRADATQGAGRDSAAVATGTDWTARTVEFRRRLR